MLSSSPTNIDFHYRMVWLYGGSGATFNSLPSELPGSDATFNTLPSELPGSGATFNTLPSEQLSAYCTVVIRVQLRTGQHHFLRYMIYKVGFVQLNKMAQFAVNLPCWTLLSSSLN